MSKVTSKRIKLISKKSLISLLCIITLLSSYFPIITNILNPKQSFAASNSCSGSSSSSKTAGKVGGVALDQAATFLAEMDDIRGAYYDETKDRIVFVGKTNTSLPEFDKDDLAVAIKALLFNKAIPAVSIEDSTISGKMEVIYYGGIDNTRFGKVLFDADMKLKQYTLSAIML